MKNTINSTPFNKDVWKELFQMFYSSEKRLFHGLILLALLTAGTEASFTLVTKAVVDEITINGKSANLLPFAGWYVALLMLLVYCVRKFIIVAGRLSMNMMYALRKRCFEHLQELSFSFYDKNAVGWLVARVTSDCARISRMIAWGTLDFFWGVPLVTGIYIVLIVLDWKMALIIGTIFPGLFWVTLYFSRKILLSSRLLRRTNSRLTAVYNEGIAGVETSKILVRENKNLEEFKEDSQQMYRLSIDNLLLSSAFYPIVTLFVSMGTGIALWFGGLGVIGGTITFGTLVAFMAYSQAVMDPLLEVAETWTNLQRTTASAERVLGLLAVQPEIIDSADVLEKIDQHLNSDGAVDGGDKEITDIEFNKVCFFYNKNEDVLSDISFRVKAGATLAFVGPTGSGKSTIVNLLCRFYEPTSGEILFNGVDYRKRSLQWLQSNLGIVLQTPFLFSGTITSNIRYGKLDATEEEIVAAAKAVNLHDIVMTMEHGYETVVQEGGNNFSTGQKQLISFARAIIGNPQILVMDEATSSVDTQTEHILQQSLARLLKGRTSFIIAHRLSTIRSADYILVIEDGELKEIGNHDELIGAHGKYYELYQKQFKVEREVELLKS